MRMAPSACFFLGFLSVNKAREVLKPLIFVPASLPAGVKDHQAGFVLMTPRSLSVILPAYNEEAVIEQTLRTIMPVLAGWMHNFEVLVINDGSRDHTAQIVARLSVYDARIKLINHPRNKGYGAALVTGFESATKETTFFMDSDGQFDIRDLIAFFPLIELYDAVLGYRIDRQDVIHFSVYSSIVYLSVL